MSCVPNPCFFIYFRPILPTWLVHWPNSTLLCWAGLRDQADSPCSGPRPSLIKYSKCTQSFKHKVRRGKMFKEKKSWSWPSSQLKSECTQPFKYEAHKDEMLKEEKSWSYSPSQLKPKYTNSNKLYINKQKIIWY